MYALLSGWWGGSEPHSNGKRGAEVAQTQFADETNDLIINLVMM